MDPILRIVHYLFEKQNIHNVEENIDTFFDKGINFPRFVALAFGIDKVPGCEPKENIFFIGMNNSRAYYYLINNNVEIKEASPSFQTTQDKKIVLSLILTKQIYHINFQATLRKVNQIIKPLEIKFETKSDILSTKCLLSLLNVLTDGKVPTESELHDFDDILIESFTIAKAPLVIDESCLEVQNQYLFFIQIEIIFDFFSEKVADLIGNMSNGNKITNISHLNEEKEENTSHDLDKRLFVQINLDEYEIKKKKKKPEKIECIENIDILNENAHDQVILDMINAIGTNCNLHFENFHEAIENDNLPTFLLYLLKDDQISQNFLNKLLDKKDFKSEIKNEIVIELLKTLEPKFRILNFDFQNPNYIESSTITLYTNILDFFFLKKSKDELYDRCYTLLYGKYRKGKFMHRPYYDRQKILTDLKVYYRLINFIKNKDCSFEPDLVHHFYQVFNDKSSIKIPIIVTESYLKSFPPKVVPPASYYQLQLIFNALDSADLSHKIVESILIKMRMLNQIEVPPLAKIAMSISTKNISLYLQLKRNKQNLQLQSTNVGIEDDNQNRKTKEIEIPKCRLYSDRRCEFSIEKVIITVALSLNVIENIDDFYNEIENNLSFSKGLLTKNDLESKCSSIWRDLINHEIADVNKEHNINAGQTAHFLNITNKSSSSSKSHFYKLFKYSPKTDEWILDRDQLRLLHSNEIVNDNVNKIPLILLLETKTSKILTILKTINNFEDTEFVFNVKETCVFGFCCNQANDMRYDKKCLYDEKNGKIKPIFLFLHVPERKKNLRRNNRIVPQILLFLSIISDVNLVCLKASKCLSQIDFINNLNRLIQSYKAKDTEIELFAKAKQTEEETDNNNNNNDNNSSNNNNNDSDNNNNNNTTNNDNNNNNNTTNNDNNNNNNDNNNNNNDNNNNDDENSNNNIIEVEYDYDYDDEEEKEQNLDDDFNKSVNDIKNDFLNKVDRSLLNNKMNLFILIPGGHFLYVKPNDQIKQSELFKPFQSLDLENSEIHFFNPTNSNTYGFIDNLLRIAIQSTNDWKTICSKFELISFFTMSRMYADLNFHSTQLLTNLERIMHTRFLMIPSENKNSTNFLTCLKILQKEMLKSYPVFDNDYFSSYDKILSDLKDKIQTKQRCLLENELRFSSESHLSYLSFMINSRPFFEKEELEAIKNSHFNFLKEEFFAIVSDLVPKNMFAEAYMNNSDILNNQISKDKYRVEAVFEIVEEKLKLKLPREVEVQKGANYTIREKENEREIKIRMEGQNLEELIEQDF